MPSRWPRSFLLLQLQDSQDGQQCGLHCQSACPLGWPPSNPLPDWRMQSGTSGRRCFISWPCMINWTCSRKDSWPQFPAVYPLYKQLISLQWMCHIRGQDCILWNFAILLLHLSRCSFIFTGGHCLREWMMEWMKIYRILSSLILEWEVLPAFSQRACRPPTALVWS